MGNIRKIHRISDDSDENESNQTQCGPLASTPSTSGNSQTVLLQNNISPFQSKNKATNFFDISNTEIKSNKIAVCKLCADFGKQTKIKMMNRGTSGLIRHLFAKHKKEYKVLYPNPGKEKFTEKNNKITEMIKTPESNNKVST